MTFGHFRKKHGPQNIVSQGQLKKKIADLGPLGPNNIFHSSSENRILELLEHMVWLDLVDRPTQLIYIWIFICQQTNIKDIAGQSARLD